MTRPQLPSSCLRVIHSERQFGGLAAHLKLEVSQCRPTCGTVVGNSHPISSTRSGVIASTKAAVRA